MDKVTYNNVASMCACFVTFYCCYIDVARDPEKIWRLEFIITTPILSAIICLILIVVVVCCVIKKCIAKHKAAN